MKIIYFIFGILFFCQSKALEVSCKFEEVYQNGQIQQGIFLFKDNKIRYQYNDNNLFTIFYHNDQTYVVSNSDKSNIKKISKQTDLFQNIVKISKDYPNLSDNYSFEDVNVSIEKSSNSFFIKRISILSPKVNLSLYFQDCREKNIIDIYFQPKPYFSYNF
tara:strand:- start:1554 stop:2036 length:483 start_codon:yes stop_codon:yes gene_type:complete